MTQANPPRFLDARFWTMTAIVLLCAGYRLLPYALPRDSALYPLAWGFTPVFAMALFSGAYFVSYRLAILIPLLSMMLSDLVLALIGWAEVGLWGRTVIYGLFVSFVLVGFWVRQNVTLGRIAAGLLTNAGIFYSVTNFRAWLVSPDLPLPGDLQDVGFGELAARAFSFPLVDGYPKTFEGLIQCYIMALPFLRNQLVGDFVFATVLFGGYALAQRWVPALRPQPALASEVS